MTTWSDAFSGRSDHDLELVLTETSYDAATNTSLVNAKLQINPPSDSASFRLSTDSTYSLTFDGTTYTGSFSYDFRTNRATKVLRSINKTITHDPDGTKSVSANGSANCLTPLGSASISSKTLTLTDLVQLPLAPAAPTLSRTTDGTSVTVTSAVASSPVEVTDYNYRHSFDGSTWSTDLAMGIDREEVFAATSTQAYYFQTRAYSSEGWGAYSSSSFIAGVPSAPGSISAIRTGRDVHVTAGSSLSNGGATITAYMVQSNDGSGWSSAVAMVSQNYTYTNLDPAETYTFRVYAVNSTGNSAPTVSGEVFIPAGGKRWDGSAFVATSTVRRWDGSAWADVLTAKRWDGSAWIDLS